jgi:uncharacterized protein YkwD
MSRARVGACCALVAVASLAHSPADAAATTPAMVTKINAYRNANGLPSLRYSPSLGHSSTAFASHLMATDRFGHDSRIRASGSFSRLGEVLAYYRSWRIVRSRIVRQWLGSPTHRAVLLSRAYRYVGAGRSRGYFGSSRATIWVAQFGS